MCISPSVRPGAAGDSFMIAIRLLAVGGAHADRRGRLSVEHVRGASHPGVLREDVGGGAFNAARVAAARGAATSILSLRGGDPSGDAVAAAIAASGIRDLSVTFLDRRSPSYTAVIDRAGEPIVGVADMALYDAAFAKQIGRRAFRDAVAQSDAILCDANLPAEALARLASLAGPRPLHAIAVSPAKAVRLAGILPRLEIVYMNRREAEALAGTASADTGQVVDRLVAMGLAAGVITQGPHEVHAFAGGRRMRLSPPPVTVGDATGAGDALAGAMTVALARGLDFAESLREGVAAAALAVQSETAGLSIAPGAFEAMLARIDAPRSTGD
jgi:pseudouridine kinase